MSSTRLALAVFAAALFVMPAQASIISGDTPLLIKDGDSVAIFAPHHAPGDGFHEAHYFATTGDAHHFAWGSATPTTPGPITVKYDFRSQSTFANLITVDQRTVAVAALTAWSAATNNKLVFVQDMLAARSSIINIGTGDLAALGSSSSVGGVLGLGGGVFTHSGATHSITSGVAWLDSAETWDATIGNGNPSGTFDYFTVVAQEIGHSLGLGHTDNTGMTNIMNGTYAKEQTALSAIDVDHITSIYGKNSVVPEPSTLAILSIGLFGLFGHERRRKRLAA